MRKKNLKKFVLKPKDVTSLIGIPEGTLRNLRWLKKGPRFFRKPGGRGVFYLLSDVKAWITSRPVNFADRAKQ